MRRVRDEPAVVLRARELDLTALDEFDQFCLDLWGLSGVVSIWWRNWLNLVAESSVIPLFRRGRAGNRSSSFRGCGVIRLMIQL
ncbi:MAG: hypothetical protein BGN97_11095 [Microbacterium sp. 69-10]|jgi:hypothetical protein|nr:MAG: hypothetical protein BGN97_11095 [Microbacterium sp. 69-10]